MELKVPRTYPLLFGHPAPSPSPSPVPALPRAAPLGPVRLISAPASRARAAPPGRRSLFEIDPRACPGGPAPPSPPWSRLCASCPPRPPCSSSTGAARPLYAAAPYVVVLRGSLAWHCSPRVCGRLHRSGRVPPRGPVPASLARASSSPEPRAPELARRRLRSWLTVAPIRLPITPCARIVLAGASDRPSRLRSETRLSSSSSLITVNLIIIIN